MKAKIPANESQRLTKLRHYAVLDTPREEAFDRLTQLAARLFKVPFAFISFIDAERQWNKSCFSDPIYGEEVRELNRNLSFCSHALLMETPVVAENTLRDERFAQNPLVTGAPNIRFYAGAQLKTQDGFILGTFCIADTKERKFSEQDVKTLNDLAILVMDKIEAKLNLQELADQKKEFEKSLENYALKTEIQQSVLPHISEIVYLYKIASGEILYTNQNPEFLKRLRFDQIDPENLMSIERHKEMLLTAGPGDFLEFTLVDHLLREEPKTYQVREALFAKSQRSQDLAFGILADITEARSLDETLFTSRREQTHKDLIFKAVLDCTTEGIIVSNTKGEFLYYNATAERIIGIGKTEGNSSLWSETYGFFLPDKKTRFPAKELPLSLAIRGEKSESVEVYVRNQRIPQGIFITMRGQPLLDEGLSPMGGIVTFNDISSVKGVEERLESIATKDLLTQLPNSNAFLKKLYEAVSEGEHGRKFYMGIIEIDDFQKISDTQGAQVAERVIVSVSRALKYRARKVDFLARWANDRFCVLFLDVDHESVLLHAKNLRNGIRDLKDPLPVTPSIGICAYSKTFAGDSEKFLKAVKFATQKAYKAGGNRIFMYDDKES